MYFVFLEVFPGTNTRGAGLTAVGNLELAVRIAKEWSDQGTDFEAWYFDSTTWNKVNE